MPSDAKKRAHQNFNPITFATLNPFYYICILINNNKKREIMEITGTGSKFTGTAADFNSLFGSVGTGKRGPKAGSKRAKATKESKAISDGNKELAEALKESKLGDSVFLKQWIRNKTASKLRNKLNKLEKLNRDQAIEKARQSDMQKVEVIARFNTKDFVYLFWILQNGSIYKEAHCRPGLRIGLDDKLQEIEAGFKINDKEEI